MSSCISFVLVRSSNHFSLGLTDIPIHALVLSSVFSHSFGFDESLRHIWDGL